MASRHLTHSSKLQMKAALRQRCKGGQWAAGQMVPALRQLAGEFGVSKEAATLVLRELASEGLLSIVPNVGTFVGNPTPDVREFYLFLLPDVETLSSSHDRHRLQVGFETRIAELGGASICLRCSQAWDARRQGLLPQIAGVFNLAFGEGGGNWPLEPQVAQVRFGNDHSHLPPLDLETDTVNFDNEGAGYMATRHLIESGHELIAYLGIHAQDAALDSTTSFKWSVAREAGWKRALDEARLPAELRFGPKKQPDINWDEVKQAIGEVARGMVLSARIDAVVAANDHVAHAFMQTLQSAEIPALQWPAIVGFDNLRHEQGHVMSSMELPSEQSGVVAADLLWERRRGLLGDAPVARYVPMRLIARLTSRARWSFSHSASELLSPLNSSLASV